MKTRGRYGLWSALWGSGATWWVLATFGVLLPLYLQAKIQSREAPTRKIVGAELQRVVSATARLRPYKVSRSVNDRLEMDHKSSTLRYLLEHARGALHAMPYTERFVSQLEQRYGFRDIPTSEVALLNNALVYDGDIINEAPRAGGLALQLNMLGVLHASKGRWQEMLFWFERGCHSLNRTRGYQFDLSGLDAGLAFSMPADVSDAVARIIQVEENWNRDHGPNIADYVASAFAGKNEDVWHDFSTEVAAKELMNLRGDRFKPLVPRHVNWAVGSGGVVLKNHSKRTCERLSCSRLHLLLVKLYGVTANYGDGRSYSIRSLGMGEFFPLSPQTLTPFRTICRNLRLRKCP